MVYIKSIDKNIFPEYLPPEADEMFSSWFCRLAYNHGVKTNTFIQNLMGSAYPLWNRDIDVLTPVELLENLEKHTPLNKDQLDNLFLKSYEGFAFHKFRTTGSINNITPLGVDHRKRKQFGQQCCPGCLSKEPVYYKKKWRLLTSVICTDCNQFLIDRCFNCGSPIIFFRINIKAGENRSIPSLKPLYLCSNCNTDLREYDPKIKPSPLEIEYQGYIDKTINDGFNEITQYSFTYIRVLLILSLRICSESKENRFRQIMSSTFHKKFNTITGEGVRFWTVDQRRETIPYMYEILKDYPATISNLFFRGAVYKRSLINDDDYIPYWFDKLFYY